MKLFTREFRKTNQLKDCCRSNSPNWFLMLLLALFISSLNVNAQITPIAVDNNPTNDCAGNDCWDWYNWSPVQDGNGNSIGGDGIAEDNACGTTIGGTVEYAGPDATPDFTGTLVGANTTDGSTPDVWTFTFDVPLIWLMLYLMMICYNYHLQIEA